MKLFVINNPSPMRNYPHKLVLLVVVLGAGTLLSCTPGASIIESYFNNTTSLGGDTPGERGQVGVSFINNTPFRAIFTYGSFDPLYDEFGPVIGQFVVDPDPTRRLEGNSSSTVFTFTCGRAIGIGDPQLIELIKS
ncbi:MAG: hypothetical protein JSV03_01780, partial [Planctomycetota bacterium]